MGLGVGALLAVAVAAAEPPVSEEVRAALDDEGMDLVRLPVTEAWPIEEGMRVDLSFPAEVREDRRIVLTDLPVLDVERRPEGTWIAVGVPLEVARFVEQARGAGQGFLADPHLDPARLFRPDPHGPNDRLWTPEPPWPRRWPAAAPPPRSDGPAEDRRPPTGRGGTRSA